MSQQLDAWEQFLEINHRARKTARRRTRRRDARFERFQNRARDRPSDPVAVVLANARYREVSPGADRCKILLHPNRQALRHLAHACADRSNLLAGIEVTRHADAVLALSAHWRDWVRPLDPWQPPQGPAGVQFASLARHLLGHYDIPLFLDAAWRAGLTPQGLIQQCWFKHIGLGQNIRTAVGLPFPLTKRMAHHFLEAPSDLDISGAFRFGQVLGLGGDARLARSLLGTRLGTHFEANHFWETVIRWLIAHPELDVAHYGPMIDYLHNQKFVPSRRLPVGCGRPRFVPPQPNLAMNGRTAESLLRAVERWHRRPGTDLGSFCCWRPSALPSFKMTEDGPAGPKVFAITELISSAELEEEGRIMGHCVATYGPLCEAGLSSIWSLTMTNAFGRTTQLLTLEVRTWTREIVQARGQRNRLAEPQELGVLMRWALAGGPRLAVPISG
jgi:hypothetical protein